MLAQSGFWNEANQDLVVIPSISFTLSQLGKIHGIGHYEERMLYHMFHLRHSKFSRILYITSLPLDPAICDYYISVIVDSIAHADQDCSREEWNLNIKSRILFLSTYDCDNLLTLSQKILSRPRLLCRIQKFIGAKLTHDISPYLSVYRGTYTEFEIGNILGLPVHAADSNLLFWGGKAGSRFIFKQLDVPHCDGSYRNPNCKKGMLKLDEGFSGKGNALVNLENVQSAILNSNNLKNLDFISNQVLKSLENAKFFGDSESWESFSRQITVIGAIYEIFVEIKETDLTTTSPSVQVYIGLNGTVEVISSHEQILENQHYLGCEFPAYRPYRHEIANYSFKIGQFLASKGVTGHFGVDFLCVQHSYSHPSIIDPFDKSDENFGVRTDWSIYAIEINLRMTGTTHPMMTLKMLTDGKLLDSGIFVTCEPDPIPCFYISLDLHFETCFKRLIPLDILEIIDKCKWRYNHDTKSGVIFHMLGAISDIGCIGLTCLGRSRQEFLLINPRFPLLSTLKLTELRALALKYGLLSNGNKPQLLSRINTHMSSLSTKESRVLAIDVGLVNLSFISIQNSLNKSSILEWDLVNLKLDNYDPVIYSLSAMKLLDRILAKNPTNIIIEAQSWRSGRIPFTILKLKSLEAILVGCIVSRGYKNVELISPKRISDYLGSTNLEIQQGNYRAKKSSSVRLVKKLLDTHEYTGCKQVFNNSSKKDDLADSFLLAYVWNEWRMNAINDFSISKK